MKYILLSVSFVKMLVHAVHGVPRKWDFQGVKQPKLEN